MSYDFNEAKEHVVNSYGRLDLILTHGEGVYLYDQDENKYLDFTSGIGVSSLGYGHEKWVKATSTQLNTVAHTSNIFHTEPSLKLAKELTEKANMSKVFFANSGAEANEGSIKLARKYSYEKYGADRNKILTLIDSFHGRTITTLKATGQEKFHKYFFPFTEGFDYVKANDLEDFKAKLTNDVCAIMLEAIQGEGGVIPLNKDFVQEVVKICNEKDVLVIFDEVQCGIGRTGKMFGYNNFDVEADIVSVAKGLGAGLPIGGILCSSKVADVFQPGDHGSTFGANPVSCSGALVVLEEICNEEYLEKISKRGAYVKELVDEAQNPQVVDVRGMGLMLGIKVKCDPGLVQKEAIKKGLLVLTAGKDVVRLLPPLVITEKELKTGIDIILEILSNIVE
ncbi:aspartate aminotransferase family protein [Clostridium chromiireducens]|uniref:Acetylornithine aminotransferase n=1 Tax=Clostridium chromiireducens TaxID=225345 RepID=A0A1V4ISJ0_9CLOT|nr:aspartate aminotransferase family protein [Clostridium chromiireducens]OPJ62982.1 acetylornithine aminotransferase [Clostridium chromiireducens]RII36427.1 aspartate aminotransferase family protein [Clostridium chromiireducens]